MKITAHSSSLFGKVKAPASKSIFQRMVVGGLLTEGTSYISNDTDCDDASSALMMAGDLGASVLEFTSGVIMEGGFSPRENKLNAGESGLGIRLFGALAALHDEEITIDGKGSLLQRPMAQFEEILSQGGVEVKTNNGLLPIKIKGPLQGGNFHLDGSLSSQFLSGLLMVLPVCEEDSVIEVSNLKSIPYVKMTLKVMSEFGINVTHENFERFIVPGKQNYKGRLFACPGDWSGAAGLFVAAAICAQDQEVEIQGLYSDYFQADQRILEVFDSIGIPVRNKENTYWVKSKPEGFRGFEFDATHCPDLFPVLAALASFAKTPSTILGVHRLKHKESDRGVAIQQELAKAGIQVIIDKDKMVIFPSEIQTCTIHSHHDHRIAMMGTILGLGSNTSVSIEDADCINKSYNHFYLDLKRLGGGIKENK